MTPILKGIFFFFIVFFPIRVSTEPLKLENILKSLTPSFASPSEELSQETLISTENRIERIEVTGNYHIPSHFIHNILTLRSGEEFNPYKINRNSKNIQSLGLFQEVTSSVEKIPGKGKRIVFYVKENPKISEIIFKGNTLFSSKELEEFLETKKEDILNFEMLRRDIQKIQEYYHKNGYQYASVFSVQTPSSKEEPLVFMIGEGRIEEIVLTGNTKTRDYVILREMDLRPGMPFRQSVFQEDIRRIYNLNFFTDIRPQVLSGSAADTKILEIEVVERPSNASFTFGGALSPQQGFSLLSDLYWDNLFGTGQLGMLKGQFNLGGSPQAGRSSTYQLKYHNPWMWDDRKSLTFRTWLTDGQLSATNFLDTTQPLIDARKKGLDLTLGLPFSYELKTFHTFKDEVIDLPSTLLKYKIHSYAFNITYDTRDIWFNPSQGDFHSFSVEKSLLFFANSLDFVKFDVGLKKFFKIADQQTLAVRLDGGVIESPQINNEAIFKSEYYIVGGGNTVRGYDETGFSFGNKRVIVSLEYRLLFNDMFQGVAFIDAGFATKGSIGGLNKYRIGKGIGIRLNLPPLGPLRLDFGIDDLSVLRTHFSIGHSF